MLCALALVLGLGLQLGSMPAANAASGTVGNGFVVTPGDLSFILKQIKIAERHTTTLSASNPCGTLVNHPGDGIPDAEQIPDYLTSYGLRTVDGSCNNLKTADTARFGCQGLRELTVEHLSGTVRPAGVRLAGQERSPYQVHCLESAADALAAGGARAHQRTEPVDVHAYVVPSSR